MGKEKDTQVDEQLYKGFDLTEYTNSDKVKALIDFQDLNGEEDVISEDRHDSNRYEINPRKVKEGTSPAKYVEVITAFKQLLTPNQRDKINSYLKLVDDFEDGCQVRDKLYKRLQTALEKKKLDKGKEVQANITICEKDALYVQNILYALLWQPDRNETTEPNHVKAYREAWFGRNVVDRREYRDDGVYLVLDDEEATTIAKERIEDSLWAFNSDFIIQHSKALDFDRGSTDILKAIQNQCESGNDAVKRLIDNLDEFKDDAIDADGRGHFICNYDGEESEQEVDGTWYYIYREN